MKKRVTLTFPKRAIQMPVTYRLAKEFNVAANIIRAQVAPNQIGKLVLFRISFVVLIYSFKK